MAIRTNAIKQGCVESLMCLTLSGLFWGITGLSGLGFASSSGGQHGLARRSGIRLRPRKLGLRARLHTALSTMKKLDAVTLAC